VDLAGGSYVVSLNTIASIATHTYVVDKVIRVTELTVTTTGMSEARFYYIESYKPGGPTAATQEILDHVEDRAKEIATRMGMGEAVNTEVTKNYPTTTHAHTIEYRVESKDAVTQLFKSVEAAWRNNADTTYKAESK
jgi:hypothetical protein